MTGCGPEPGRFPENPYIVPFQPTGAYIITTMPLQQLRIDQTIRIEKQGGLRIGLSVQTPSPGRPSFSARAEVLGGRTPAPPQCGHFDMENVANCVQAGV